MTDTRTFLVSGSYLDNSGASRPVDTTLEITGGGMTRTVLNAFRHSVATKTGCPADAVVVTFFAELDD